MAAPLTVGRERADAVPGDAERPCERAVADSVAAAGRSERDPSVSVEPERVLLGREGRDALETSLRAFDRAAQS